MKKTIATAAAVFVMALALGVAGAWAEPVVTITREESKPKTVEIKAGEEVRFVNNSGGTAHVWFGGDDAIRFYVGEDGSRIKFDKSGTYDYTVHVAGTKVHSHTGIIVAK